MQPSTNLRTESLDGGNWGKRQALTRRAGAGGGYSGSCGAGRGSGRERVGVHVRVPGSYPLPASTSSPPLSLFLSLYDAFSTLAAKALMSEAAAGADWADARVRESSS